MAGIGTGYSDVERDHGHGAGRPAAFVETLKAEICRLRQRMELAYLEEDSLHAERVIEFSRKLDMKINEYMRYKLRCLNG